MIRETRAVFAKSAELPARIVRLGGFLLAVGVLAMIVGYALDPGQAAFSNTVLFLFVTSLAVGSLFLIAVEYLAGAVWSVPMRRVIEFLAGLTPFLLFLAVPLFFRLHDLFHWTHADAAGSDPLLQGKQPYLNVQFFLLRFAAVFLLWNLFYVLFIRNSVKQDTLQDASLTKRNIRLSAVFLPVFAISLTVTAIDWAMSLEPHWFSTIFGVYYFSGTVLAALAVATLVIVSFQKHGLLPNLRPDHYYSLGALMFGFINFWAYIAFSQFMLVWYANIPEETFWFMRRWEGGWEIVSVLLIVVHFGVPYFVLLPQAAKMDPRRLRFMAYWILAAHLLDLFWLIMPTHHRTVSVSWMDLLFPAVAAGLIILLLTWKTRRYNTIPVGDPKLQRGLEFYL